LPQTCTALIDGLCHSNANSEQWRECAQSYWPVLVGYARRMGVPREDARDIAQSTLLALRRTLTTRRFDRSRGGLRKLVFSIAHRQVVNWYRSRGAAGRPAPLPDTGVSRLQARAPRRADSVSVWTRQCRRAALQRCFARIRTEVSERTFAAFELFALRCVPAAEVAAQLEITENAVFGAKRRIVERLRELLLHEEGAAATALKGMHN
jgi:RNA polymerase sigma-70 factor (ECF subfamily)